MINNYQPRKKITRQLCYYDNVKRQELKNLMGYEYDT